MLLRCARQFVFAFTLLYHNTHTHTHTGKYTHAERQCADAGLCAALRQKRLLRTRHLLQALVTPVSPSCASSTPKISPSILFILFLPLHPPIAHLLLTSPPHSHTLRLLSYEDLQGLLPLFSLSLSLSLSDGAHYLFLARPWQHYSPQITPSGRAARVAATQRSHALSRMHRRGRSVGCVHIGNE